MKLRDKIGDRFDIQKPEIHSDDRIREKGAKYVFQHKLKVSALSIILMILAFIFRLPPFSLIYLLPGWIGKAFLMLIASQLVAFYPARIGYNALKSVNYDLIFVVNPADRTRIKMYQMSKGQFMAKYEFKNGKPLSWENQQGINCFLVLEVDKSEKTAYCPYLGDYGPQEVLAFEEAWKAQRLKNDRQRSAGTDIKMKAGQIASKIRARVSNAWIRDLQELEFDKNSREGMADVLPDDIEEDIEIDDDLLSDLEANADKSKTLQIVDSEDSE